MSKAFGTQFIITNDVVQLLDPEIFGGGPWLHLATVRRGLREYMAFRKSHDAAMTPEERITPKVWVEIIDPHEVALRKIEDNNEWLDVVNFLQEAKLLEIGSRRELHIDTTLTN